MSNDTQSRKWQLTINNPINYGYTHEYIIECLNSFKSLDYWCLSDEVGKNNTFHSHVFLFRETKIRFSKIQNTFPHCHIEMAKGTIQENIDYCKKEGRYKGTYKEETNIKDSFECSGEAPYEKQGRRSDLIELYDMIKQGMNDYEIMEENPEYLLKLDKIERARQVVKSQTFNNSYRQVEVQYIFGATGKGKTKGIYDKYGFNNVYRVTDYKNPFDTYEGQDVLVFDEYRSQINISLMLTYLDYYPLKLPARYLNKTACFTKIYIISNIPLEEQYPDIQKRERDTWKAFLRRIGSVKYYRENGEIETYLTVDKYFRSCFLSTTNFEIPF